MTNPPDDVRLIKPPDWAIETIFALLGLLAAAVWLAPSLLGVRVLLPADLVLLFAPWSETPAARELAGFSSNPMLWDAAFTRLPWAHIVGEAIRAGEWPLWNPYFRLGMPLLGNGQAAPFSPIDWLNWALPLPLGFAWSTLLRIGLAWAGVWLLGRRLGLARPFALTLCVAWAFSPASLSWLQHPNSLPLSTLPWLLWTAEGIVRAPDRPRILLRSAALAFWMAFHLYGGHFQGSFNASLTAGVYFLARLATSSERRDWAWKLAGAGAGVALGVAMALPMVVPFVQTLRDSATLGDRAARRVGEYHLGLPEALHFWNPMAHGTHLFGSRVEWTGRANWCEQQQYIGLLPWAFLLVLPLVWRSATASARRMLLAWGVAFIVIGSLAYGWWPIQPLALHLPVFPFNRNMRFSLDAQVLLIVLGVLSAQGWFDRAQALTPRHARAFTWLLAGAATFALIVMGLTLAEDWGNRQVAMLGCAVVVAIATGLGAPRRLLWLLPAVWVLDVAPAWRGFHPQVRQEWAQAVLELPHSWAMLPPDEHPWGSLDNARVVATDVVRENSLSLFGIADPRAYDWPIAQRHDLFFTQVLGVETTDLITAEHYWNPWVLRGLRRLGCPWFLSQFPLGELPGGEGLQAVATFPSGVKLHRDDTAASFGEWFPAEATHLVATLEDALRIVPEALRAQPEVLVVESDSPAVGAITQDAGLAARLLKGTSQSLAFALPPDAAGRPGWLLVRTSYDTGWRAESAGRPLAVRPAQVKFLAVEVSAGTTHVHLHYWPRGFTAALWSALAAVLLTALLAVLAARTMRRTPDVEA